MSQAKPVWLLLGLLIGCGTVGAQTALTLPNPDRVELLASDRQVCALYFETSDVEINSAQVEGVDQDIYSIPGEGVTIEPGRPMLPALSRFVVVPPQCGLALQVETQSARAVRSVHPPVIINDPQIGPVLGRESWAHSELYPPVAAEMSEPFIIRGVRLVKLTVYPIQYNAQTQSYIHHTSVNAEIQFTNDPPVNPVEHPALRGRSQQFYKFIESLAVNGDQVRRDDPDGDEPRPYVGHYLIVTHTNCLQYAAPFIEWRRKAGYKVDILSLSAGDAGNVGTIQQRIRQLYQGYVQQGLDPFEYMLLIGDRQSHYYPPQSEWILESQTGQPTWGVPHADYLLACMDDRDNWPDVAVARWPSGSRDRMELAVGRTLAYEMTPRMDNPEWFTRAGVYTQHWGNDANGAWHVTIHTNVRWGEEVLKSLGFNDITFYERYEYDQFAAVLGPVVRDLLNNGTNVMLGRAENYYFVPGRGNHDFNQDVRDNTVFPMELNTSGHGEWSREIMFRTGSGQHLKGFAATTFAWNGPPTAPMSAVWMEMVNGLLQRDLPFGWAYVKGITAFQLYFPDFQWSGRSLYANVSTETNDFGDPAMQPWIGVPRIVTAEAPDTLSPESRIIAVRVLDSEGENPVAGAQVTFYAPGNMPAFDNANYAAYNRMFTRTTTSDESGWVRLMVENNADLEGNTAFVTITGRDIRPLITPIPIRANRPVVELAEYALDDPNGNRDHEVNPGETIQLNLIARNLGNRDPAREVRAQVISLSPWVEVENSEVQFGDIEAGQTAEANSAVILHISPTCPDGSCRPSTKPLLSVVFTSGEQVWNSAIQLNPRAPRFSIIQIVGGNIIPANRHELNIEILNEGRMEASRLAARISNLGMGVGVVTENAVYPALDVGESARVTGNLFLVAGNRIAVPGSLHKIMLTLTTEPGFVDTVYFTLQVGEARENAPLGPDPYGYICFDDTDQDWDIAPRFEWVEISPRAQNPDVEGTSCEFTGQSDQNIGESRVIALGFTTRFYGHEYDRITIGTNGFIAVGNQPRITNFQNWPMERCQGGGVGMIAPLWDDLQLPNGSQVYYFYDEDQARFIVEWYRLRHRSGGENDLNFQVILYDAEVWCPGGEDNNILFQYRNVTNVQGMVEGVNPREKQTPFASVGISSPDGNSGLGYSWENRLPVPAAPLVDRRALLFATSPRFRSGYLFGHVTDAANGAPIEGAIVYTEHGFTASTNVEGFWEINNALAEVPFDITAMK
ncbi:MAG: C25 family cysteine peptidase, partial [Calditrichota bacterium]